MPSNPLNQLLAMADQTKPYKKALQTGLQPNQSALGDPSVENYLLQSALADEAEQNAIMAQRGGAAPGDLQGLKNFFTSSRANMAASPITAQKAQTDAYMNEEQEAIRQGYADDPITTSFGNTWEMQGSSPIANRRTQVDEQQRYLSNSGERTAAEQGKQLMRRDLVNQGFQASQQQNFLDNMKNLQSGGQQGQLDNVRLPTKTGGGGFSFDTSPNPTVAPALASRMASARSQFEMAKGTANEAAAKAQLDSINSSYLSNYPAPPELKQFAQEVMNNPDASGFTIDEIIQAQAPGLPPQYVSQLKDMLRQLGRAQ